MSNLTQKTCDMKAPAMTEEQIESTMSEVPGWDYTGKYLTTTKEFKNHYHAMTFANAVAWISHQENHHPDMKIGYKDVTIEYWTHSVNGISINDFICAAKVNDL